MSEKRFRFIKNFQPTTFIDMENGKHYDCGEVVNLLNKMSYELEEVEISIRLFEDDVQVKDKKIEEQQITINKLKEENRELRKDIDLYKYESKLTIQFLQDENEQLRKELNDCEKFRYTVFKRIGELER